MKSIHVIYVSEDGVATFCCGVGTITQHFIAAFPDIARAFLEQSIVLRLSIITIQPARGTVGIRPDLLRIAQHTCRRYRGRVHTIPARILPTDDYFNISVWRTYNNEANAVIRAITDPSDARTIVIANDTIFAHCFGSGARTLNVWIPHSLSYIHAQSYTDNAKRWMWEQRAVRRICNREHHLIGYVSPYARQVFRSIFALPNTKLIPFRYGFYNPLLDQYRLSRANIARQLHALHIPTNRKLILSFGRADEYKGLDISLRTMIRVVQAHPRYCGVLFAARFSWEPIVDVVHAGLKHILQGISAPVYVFSEYEFNLPKLLLTYPNTAFLLNLPTRDFCPLVPFEAQMIGHKNLCVINSNLSCFRGLIRHRRNGFLCAPTMKSAVATFDRILLIPDAERRAIIRRGQEDVKMRFDIAQNYVTSIQHLLRLVS